MCTRTYTVRHYRMQTKDKTLKATRVTESSAPLTTKTLKCKNDCVHNSAIAKQSQAFYIKKNYSIKLFPIEGSS